MDGQVASHNGRFVRMSSFLKPSAQFIDLFSGRRCWNGSSNQCRMRAAGHGGDIAEASPDGFATDEVPRCGGRIYMKSVNDLIDTKQHWGFAGVQCRQIVPWSDEDMGWQWCCASDDIIQEFGFSH